MRETLFYFGDFFIYLPTRSPVYRKLEYSYFFFKSILLKPFIEASLREPRPQGLWILLSTDVPLFGSSPPCSSWREIIITGWGCRIFLLAFWMIVQFAFRNCTSAVEAKSFFFTIHGIWWCQSYISSASGWRKDRSSLYISSIDHLLSIISGESATHRLSFHLPELSSDLLISCRVFCGSDDGLAAAVPCSMFPFLWPGAASRRCSLACSPFWERWEPKRFACTVASYYQVRWLISLFLPRRFDSTCG